MPKWKSYGDTTGLFTCGTGDIAVVVEDAASACAISNLEGYVGAALLGTNISPKQKQQLKHYSRVIISLDKDASGKAIKLLSKLTGHVKSVTVVLLEEDLKNLNTQQLEELYDESKRYCSHRL
jgi:5S rRNA maturation endonuclease (ribonuclease M5)